MLAYGPVQDSEERSSSRKMVRFLHCACSLFIPTGLPMSEQLNSSFASAPAVQAMVSEQYVNTPDGRLNVKRWSPGAQSAQQSKAPIVLMHDSLGSVSLWRDFPGQLALATGRDVIAYDRLGFGKSDAHPSKLTPSFVEDEVRMGFAPVHQALGLTDFVLFGHSVGGGMAAMVAAAYPEQCKALITESAQTFVEDRTLNGIREARDNFAQSGQMERLSKYHGDKAAWVLSAWVDTWLTEEFSHYRLDGALAQVHCPVLAIHGELDEFGSLVHPENIRQWVKGPAQTEIIAGGGHVPHRELPERILACVAAFLKNV